MITSHYLNEMATFTRGKVQKVVLNGSYEITGFQIKEVSEEELIMQYMVPNGSVAEITLLELKDSADQVISTNVVNVPITADSLLLHTIKLLEG
ncbi:ketopantoate hydroxymethyltransferase [Paenibacillus sepulcri]|uniref:Ketopantoate hydroxymethyltransferase n=1 Tax=Paenibacillus sepulcri TaxID=359917 RepID=A0ABS7C173_9BACL|nr:ketopantoate hydroxymethyltransferase [Paenibacillus sepulcri]